MTLSKIATPNHANIRLLHDIFFCLFVDYRQSFQLVSTKCDMRLPSPLAVLPCNGMPVGIPACWKQLH